MIPLKLTFDSIIDNLEPEKLFFYDRRRNILFHTDEEFQNIEMFLKAKDYVTTERFAAIGSFCMEQSWFFGSQSNPDVLEYNHREKKFYRYNPDEEILEKCLWYPSRVGDRLFLFPSNPSLQAWIFDMKKREYTSFLPIKEDGYIPYNFYADGYIYLPLRGTNKLYILDTQTLQCQPELFPEGTRIATMHVVGNRVFTLQENSSEMIIKEDEHIRYVKLDDAEGEELFSRMFCIDNDVFIMPRFHDILYKYNLSADVVSKYKVPVDEAVLRNTEKNKSSLFSGYYIKDNKVYFPPWRDEKLYIFDMEKCEFSVQKLGVKLYDDLLSYFKLLVEGNCTLDEFIEVVIEQ